MRKIIDAKSIVFAVEDVYRGWNDNYPVSCYYDVRVERHRSLLIDVFHPKKISYNWSLIVLVTIRDLNFFTSLWYKWKFKKLIKLLKEGVADGGFVINETYGLLFFNKKLTNNGLKSFQAVLTINLKDEPKLPRLHSSSERRKVVFEYGRSDFVSI